MHALLNVFLANILFSQWFLVLRENIFSEQFVVNALSMGKIPLRSALANLLWIVFQLSLRDFRGHTPADSTVLSCLPFFCNLDPKTILSDVWFGFLWFSNVHWQRIIEKMCDSPFLFLNSEFLMLILMLKGHPQRDKEH